MSCESMLEGAPLASLTARGDESDGEEPLAEDGPTEPVLVLGRPGFRLTSVARWMRERGLFVVEVGTPLDAISLLLDSALRFSSVFVAGPIAGTPSVVVAAVLKDAFPDVRVVPG